MLPDGTSVSAAENLRRVRSWNGSLLASGSLDDLAPRGGTLAPVEVIGNPSTLYSGGDGVPIRVDGDTRYFADGYSQLDGNGVSNFVPADMTWIGPRLSPDEYDYVSDRAAKLSSKYDAPGLWHDFKEQIDGLLGITPNPVLSESQQQELVRLQGIANARVQAAAFPENYSPTLQQLDAIRHGGPFTGATYLGATIAGARPETKLALSRGAMGLSGTVGALGGVYAARRGTPLSLSGGMSMPSVPGLGLLPGDSGFTGPLPKMRIPGEKWGTFEGVPGYSEFVPSNPGSLGLKPGQTIPWRGVPDFSEYGPTFKVNGLTGDPRGDRDRAIEAIARQRGMSTDAVSEWLTRNELRIHHFMGDEVQVAPALVHRLPHQGSASLLRNSGEINR